MTIRADQVEGGLKAFAAMQAGMAKLAEAAESRLEKVANMRAGFEAALAMVGELPALAEHQAEFAMIGAFFEAQVDIQEGTQQTLRALAKSMATMAKYQRLVLYSYSGDQGKAIVVDPEFKFDGQGSERGA